MDVFTDENVKWKPHIHTTSTKISKSIGIFYRARLIIPTKHLNQFHFSFVHSYLNYASLPWGSTRKTELSALYRQQKNSFKLLSLDQFTHTRLLFKEI